MGPRFVDRDKHFFGTLYEILKERPEVKKLTPVPHTLVPIIKMVFDGVEIDLVYARIGQKTIDPNLESLQDDNLLKNCDAESIRSLNGC